MILINQFIIKHMSIIDYCPDICTELVKYFTFKGKLKLRLICKTLYNSVFAHFQNNNPKIPGPVDSDDINTYPFAIFTKYCYKIDTLTRFANNLKCIESNIININEECEIDINNIHRSIRKLSINYMKELYMPNIIISNITELYISAPLYQVYVLPKTFLEYFPNLTTLFLAQYTLENPIPLLSKVEKISMHNIKSEHGIGHLMTVRKIFLNNVSDAILKSIKDLINIEKLGIGYVHIKDLSIYKLKKLICIALYNIPDVTNDFFMHNTTIKTLKIECCNLLTDECLSKLINCTHLTLMNFKFDQNWSLISLKKLYLLNIKYLLGAPGGTLKSIRLLTGILHELRYLPDIKVIKASDNKICHEIIPRVVPNSVIIRWNSESIHDAIYRGLPKDAIY